MAGRCRPDRGNLFSGFVNGDTAASLTWPPMCSTTVTSSSTAGDYPGAATCSGAVDPDYTISYVAGDVTVGLAPSSGIGFTGPGTGTYGGSASLSATGGGSSAPVVLTIDPSSDAGVCTIVTPVTDHGVVTRADLSVVPGSGSGSVMLSYTGVGTCLIDANQGSDGNTAAASQVQQSITVSPAKLTIKPVALGPHLRPAQPDRSPPPTPASSTATPPPALSDRDPALPRHPGP